MRRRQRSPRSRLRPVDAAATGTHGLRSRRGRALLTAIGIAIGIASMIAVLGISSSSKADLIAGYESQTQIMYPWQTSPVLTSASITERCSQPEWLLVSNPVNPISDFQGSGVMLRLAHLAQTLGKRRKDQAVAITVGIRDWLRPNSDRR